MKAVPRCNTLTYQCFATVASEGESSILFMSLLLNSHNLLLLLLCCSATRSHVILLTEPASQFVRARESVALLSAPPRYLQALICTRSDGCSISQVWHSVCARGVEESLTPVVFFFFPQDISVVTGLLQGEIFAVDLLKELLVWLQANQYRCASFGEWITKFRFFFQQFHAPVLGFLLIDLKLLTVEKCKAFSLSRGKN